MNFFRIFALSLILVVSVVGRAAADEPPSQLALCKKIQHSDVDYVACEFQAGVDAIKLFHTSEAGAPYADFNALKAALEARGDILLFAMNAGMYHENRMPVGLYVENGEKFVDANTNDGPGNFHLKPNGVFYVTDTGAGVAVTESFLESGVSPDFATQSGPMLVINGGVHPKFLPDSDSRKRRNGVGVSADGARVVFVISDDPVTFHDFAMFFRDELKVENALFLDGSVSRLYAPELNRNDAGLPMGPIVGVTISTGVR